MPQFLFQPDSIDSYEFNPIPIDIHLGIIKISNEEIINDFEINNTESIIVGTDRMKVLDRIQTTFAREFERYGNLKNQRFDIGIINLNRHGQGLESISRMNLIEDIYIHLQIILVFK